MKLSKGWNKNLRGFIMFTRNGARVLLGDIAQ